MRCSEPGMSVAVAIHASREPVAELTSLAMRKTAASLIATTAAAFALSFAMMAFQNPPSRQPVGPKEFDLTVLVLGSSVLVVLVALAWLRSSRTTYYSSLGASVLLFCYPMLCLLS